MSIFAVIHSNTESNNSQREFILDALSNHYIIISFEADEGIYFIKSDHSSEEILDQIADCSSLDLLDCLYVFKLTNEFSSSGTTKVRRALQKAMGLPQV